MQRTYVKNQGFTIVELLIVIVVIGILAAISIIAYNSITTKAAEAAVKSDLTQAAKQLAMTNTESGAYPGIDGTTTDGSSSPVLQKSKDNTLQYTKTGSSYCLTATSARQGVPAYYVSSTSQTPTAGVCPGHTGPSMGDGSSIANNTPIQNVTQSQCQALPVYTGSNNGALRTLTDSRGGVTRAYTIGRLADSKCWMLDNLRLGSTSGPVTLTSGDSNVSDSFTLPQVQASGSSSYDSPTIAGPVPGDSGSGATNYGYLYNFLAATAGATRTSLPAGTADAPSSICPRGWKLPTGSVGGDFSILDAALGGTGDFQHSSVQAAKWNFNGPFRGVLAGNWFDDGDYSRQDAAGLWSSSASDRYADNAQLGYFTSGYVTPGEVGDDRSYGYGVRCLLN